jgi:hypothetical protein
MHLTNEPHPIQYRDVGNFVEQRGMNTDEVGEFLNKRPAKAYQMGDFSEITIVATEP